MSGRNSDINRIGYVALFGVAPLLSDLSRDVAHCYQRAAGCAERAGSCANPEMREFYLEREQAWLKLARSYQFAERISRKLGQVNGQEIP